MAPVNNDRDLAADMSETSNSLIDNSFDQVTQDQTAQSKAEMKPIPSVTLIDRYMDAGHEKGSQVKVDSGTKDTKAS